MDKKFLEKNNLLETQERFHRMANYNFLWEVDDPQQPPMGGMPAPDQMGGGMPGGDSIGGVMQGGDPSAMGGAPGSEQAPNSQDPAADTAPEGQGGVDSFNPQVPDTSVQQTPVPEENSDEEVIDVDDLTKSQEKAESKITDVEGKMEKLMSLIDKVEADIERNNASMEQLKQEFEKRNPTQVEKMTLRAKQGYPFTQSPDDYWAKKEEEGNYSPEDDNNGEGEQRYTITKDDVNNITDWDSIYKSIDKGNFHQSLKDILNF